MFYGQLTYYFAAVLRDRSHKRKKQSLNFCNLSCVERRLSVWRSVLTAVSEMDVWVRWSSRCTRCNFGTVPQVVCHVEPELRGARTLYHPKKPGIEQVCKYWRCRSSGPVAPYNYGSTRLVLKFCCILSPMWNISTQMLTHLQAESL